MLETAVMSGTETAWLVIIQYVFVFCWWPLTDSQLSCILIGSQMSRSFHTHPLRESPMSLWFLKESNLFCRELQLRYHNNQLQFILHEFTTVLVDFNLQDLKSDIELWNWNTKFENVENEIKIVYSLYVWIIIEKKMDNKDSSMSSCSDPSLGCS